MLRSEAFVGIASWCKQDGIDSSDVFQLYGNEQKCELCCPSATLRVEVADDGKLCVNDGLMMGRWPGEGFEERLEWQTLVE